TTHAPVPLQPPPDHEVRSLCASGAAASVTLPTVNAAVQLLPHAMPEGVDVTVPVPVPARTTVSAAVPTPLNAAAAPPSESDAALAPTACGANATATWHEAPTSSVVGQSFAVTRKLVGSLPTSIGVTASAGAVPWFETASCTSALCVPSATA